MSTTSDFRSALKRAIEAHWHGRPPASLEDVMTLYGILAVAESGGELYTTPSKLDSYVDDGRLVTIDVDLTGAEPEIDDVQVATLLEQDVPKLGYSHKSSGRGAKYSLTQTGSKNGNDADGVATTILPRFRSWTGQDSVQSLTGEDGHPDGWVVELLADIFEKDSDSLEGLKKDVRSLLPPDESLPTVVTVRLRVDAAELESLDGSREQWVWPAELDVLNEAMKRYASANAANKNIDSGSSEGEGVGVVTGERGRVVGTPESPLGIFSVKHPDAQPGLRKDASWRHYPVDPDVAMLFSKGQDLVERCVYRRGGMETYALPYFAGELTAAKADTLYGAIQSLDPDGDYDESDDAPMARVTYKLQEHDDEVVRELAERELRFYTITLPIGDDKHVIAEEPAASSYWIFEIADALVETARGPTLDPRRGGFTRSDNWPLLDISDDQDEARRTGYGLIVSQAFTDSVFGYRDEEGDDFRRVVDHRLISGVSLGAQTLFEEYLRRYRDESEDGTTPPYQIVAQQLVHLETLSRAGLLDGLDVPIEHDSEHMTTELTDIHDTDVDTTDIAAIREHRLDSFLDRPLFQENAERKHTERTATALAGVLVGQISWHQENKRGIGRPLDTTTKGDQMTPNGLENALTSALEKAKLYAADSDRGHHRDVLFPETVDRLLDVTDDMPSRWDIEKSELRFCYVLGHAHGRRSMPVAFDLHDSEDESSSTTDGETTTN